MPQRTAKRAPKRSAATASQPPGLRLDELDADVRAGQLGAASAALCRQCVLLKQAKAAAWPVQVLQAIAAHLSEYHYPRSWTEAFTLQAVCRCALDVASGCCTKEPASGEPRPEPCTRRFKAALQEPFWTTVHASLVASLWRALNRPGAPLLSRAIIECLRDGGVRTHGLPSACTAHCPQNMQKATRQAIRTVSAKSPLPGRLQALRQNPPGAG